MWLVDVEEADELQCVCFRALQSVILVPLLLAARLERRIRCVLAGNGVGFALVSVDKSGWLRLASAALNQAPWKDQVTSTLEFLFTTLRETAL